MFSYIFMKILEKRPERYDTGIDILSGGHARKIRKQIVQNYAKPDTEILDIGCGTGLLILDAAKAGARTTGLNISSGMLAVAQKKIANNGMLDRITLHNAGVVEIDSLGHLFSAGVFNPGKIHQDVSKCNNCRICLIVCPKGVYGIVDRHKIRIKKQWECFACNACITQCSEDSLFLG